MSRAILYCGDALAVLKTLPSESVQMVCTSPPYWGLRDYGTARWEGGDNACKHIAQQKPPVIGSSSTLGYPADGGPRRIANDNQYHQAYTAQYRDVCAKCGAQRVDAQIGLEPTPARYVGRMVEIFGAVRRVLRDDGIVWLNLGDTYAANRSYQVRDNKHVDVGNTMASSVPDGLKVKDLVGIPWRLAFALQADGWWLRSDIIWAKRNPMPESVTDRPTKAHEYVFLFAKGQWVSRVVQFSDLCGERVHFGRYLGATKPPARHSGTKFCVALATAIFDGAQQQQQFTLPPFYAEEWKQGAGGEDSNFVRGLPIHHRATASAARLLCSDSTAEKFLRELNGMGIALTERNEFLVGGIDAEMPLPPTIHRDSETTIAIHDSGEIGKFDFGHSRIIVVRPTTCNYFYDAAAIAEDSSRPGEVGSLMGFKGRTLKAVGRDRCDPMYRAGGGQDGNTIVNAVTRNARTVWEIATQPYPEAHFATFPEELARRCILAGSRPGDTILDPFGGSGTVAQVATGHGRKSIYIDLNPKYLELAKQRIGPMLCDVAA